LQEFGLSTFLKYFLSRWIEINCLQDSGLLTFPRKTFKLINFQKLIANMRLDQYLVENNLVPTRAKAKRAVEEGLVLIDGQAIKKPAKQIKETDRVELKDQKLAGMPNGYYKLKALQEKTGIIKDSDTVLDLGSSAGGYLLFASEIANQIYGIEFSEEFRETLEKIEQEHENIHICIGNVFDINPEDITKGNWVDFILNDLTVNWMATIEVLGRVLPLLNPGGRVLMTLKLGGETAYGVEEVVKKMLESHNLVVKQFLELENEKDEIYVIAEKAIE